MTKIDVTKQLAPQTIGKILEFLESRPLRDVYGLFQEIVSQLEVKDSGQPNTGLGANSLSVGDGGVSGSGVPTLAAE
jgi:hypothetical protein